MPLWRNWTARGTSNPKVAGSIPVIGFFVHSPSNPGEETLVKPQRSVGSGCIVGCRNHLPVAAVRRPTCRDHLVGGSGGRFRLRLLRRRATDAVQRVLFCVTTFSSPDSSRAAIVSAHQQWIFCRMQLLVLAPSADRPRVPFAVDDTIDGRHV